MQLNNLHYEIGRVQAKDSWAPQDYQLARRLAREYGELLKHMNERGWTEREKQEAAE